MSAVNSNYALYSSLGLTGGQDSASTSSSTSSSTPSSKLGIKDFMNLLVTQLTHQDPTKPMENTQLATQISQFATVSGIDDLNTSFSDFASNMMSNQSIQASNLVGREVSIQSYLGVLPSDGGSMTGSVYLPSDGTNVKVKISDQSGALVRELDLGQQASGMTQFSWDGITDSGDYASPGKYTISASATIDGADQGLSTTVNANVDSVSIGGSNGVMVNLDGLGLVSASDILEIH